MENIQKFLKDKFLVNIGYLHKKISINRDKLINIIDINTDIFYSIQGKKDRYVTLVGSSGYKMIMYQMQQIIDLLFLEGHSLLFGLIGQKITIYERLAKYFKISDIIKACEAIEVTGKNGTLTANLISINKINSNVLDINDKKINVNSYKIMELHDTITKYILKCGGSTLLYLLCEHIGCNIDDLKIKLKDVISEYYIYESKIGTTITLNRIYQYITKVEKYLLDHNGSSLLSSLGNIENDNWDISVNKMINVFPNKFTILFKASNKIVFLNKFLNIYSNDQIINFIVSNLNKYGGCNKVYNIIKEYPSIMYSLGNYSGDNLNNFYIFIKMHGNMFELSDDNLFVRSTSKKEIYTIVHNYLTKCIQGDYTLYSILIKHLSYIENNIDNTFFNMYEDRIQKYKHNNKIYVRLVNVEDTNIINKIKSVFKTSEESETISIEYIHKKIYSINNLNKLIRFLNKYVDIFKISKDNVYLLDKNYENIPKVDIPMINSKQIVDMSLKNKPDKILFIDGDHEVIHTIDNLIYLQNIHIHICIRKYDPYFGKIKFDTDNITLSYSMNREKDAVDNFILSNCMRIHAVCPSNIKMAILTKDKKYSTETILILNDEGRDIYFIENIDQLQLWMGNDAKFL